MKKILILCIVTLLCIQNTYAEETLNSNGVSTKVERIFSTYVSRAEKKYSKNATLSSVKKLEGKLVVLFEKKEITGDRFIILDSLLKLIREYLSDDIYSKQKFKRDIALNKHKITKDFSRKILSRNDVFLEDGIWYTYIFKSHLSFPEGVIPSNRDLDYNKISTKDDLVFITSSNTLGFVKDFTKVKLVSDNIIFGIPNKFKFLEEVQDDKKYIQLDTDIDFKNIKAQSKEITQGLHKKEDIIAAIYNHVLENVNYTQPIVLDHKEIFSGIETYKNKDGVCEGYVKYFQYLLQFAGIQDVESIRGYVIDAQDYPNIGHAWTRIGDYYYDSTFDDPIGQTETKVQEDYIFYKLPKDLFYTNRYDYGKSNEVLEKAPLEFRQQYIRKQLVTVYPKYKDSDYNIIKDIRFRDETNLDYYKEIDITSLKQAIGFTKVKEFNFTEDGKDKRITNLNFYTLNDSKDIDTILKQLRYNLEGHKLLEWEEESGDISYRLGFNIITNF